MHDICTKKRNKWTAAYRIVGNSFGINGCLLQVQKERAKDKED
jgi:hypothetical protein